MQMGVNGAGLGENWSNLRERDLKLRLKHSIFITFTIPIYTFIKFPDCWETKVRHHRKYQLMEEEEAAAAAENGSVRRKPPPGGYTTAAGSWAQHQTAPAAARDDDSDGVKGRRGEHLEDRVIVKDGPVFR